jgi:ferric-dicitrate binding protein FerR (iron transport regulator)
MQMLKMDMQKLNAQYKQGAITAEAYIAQHSHMASQLERTKRAQQDYNRALHQQPNNQAINQQSMLSKAASGSVRNALSVGAVAGGAAAVGAGFVLGSSLKKAMDYEAQLSSVLVVLCSTAR